VNGQVHRTRPQRAYEAQLPAELESAVAARRLLSSAVAAWKLGDSIRNDGALAVSELVTNSVLHAGTAARVRVERLGEGIRIEVEDGNPHLPAVDAVRPEDLLANDSMTGRGLALVAATSDRWGADPCPAGKVTWAEIGTGQTAVDPARTRTCDAVSRSAAHRAGRRVHLVGVPVSLLLESTRQLSDLRREVQVMAMGRDAPPELEQVVQAGQPWIADIELWNDLDRRTAESAAASGADMVDFDVFVPDDIVSRIEGIATWLRRAASSIMRRHLLTLPPTKEVTAYRRWYSEEVVGQLAGRAPRPCPIRMKALRPS
jgi:anti-sigma regulatory factor (Ser/Thr protein kinase)